MSLATDESLSGPRNNGLTSSEFDVYANALVGVKSVGGGEYRSLCPMPECAQKQQARHNSFSFNKSGPYICHRCGAEGHLHQLPALLPHLGLPAPKSKANGINAYEKYERERGISKPTLDEFGVSFSNGLPAFLYPSGAKKLKKETGYVWTGDKQQKTAPGLFGADQTSTSNSSKLFIVEGESDTLAFAEAGISAVSLPAGAGSVRERDLEALKALEFEQHIVLYDKDDAGLRGGNKLREAMEAQGLKVSQLSYPSDYVTGYDGVMAWNEADRNPERFQKVLDSLPEAPPIPEEWPEILNPLETVPEPIPLDAMPPVLSNIVRSVASALQVPKDFVALLALCAVSAAVGGKFWLQISGSWLKEWSVLYGVAILKSGERKSPAFSLMMRPITDYIADKMKAQESGYRMALAEVEIVEDQIKSLKKLIAHGEPKTKKNPNPRSKEDLRDELEQAFLDQIKYEDAVPASANILVGDITTPELVERAGQTKGRVAQLVPEGVVLRLLDGKHNDGKVDAEFHKQAYDGETYLRDRVGTDNKSVKVESPALTMCCAVQPAVLNDLRNVDMLTDEGILARCCFVQPPSLVGSRNPKDQTEVDAAAYLEYEMAIQRLLEVDHQEPVKVTVTDEAQDELNAYVWSVEQRLHPLRSLAAIPTWALKNGGRAVRIAAHQTMIARALESADIFAPIEGEAVRDAVRIAEALASQARRTLINMGLDPHTKLLKYVLDKRIECGPEATLRDLLKACRKFQRKEQLEPLVEELEQMGYLKLKPVPSAGGRPPSPKVLVNPDYKRAKCATSPNEETSVPIGTDEEEDYERIERLAIQQENDDGLPF